MILITNDGSSQEEDVEEFYNSSGITWKLSAQEARAIAAHRI
jgi:hypothetical protein